MFTPQEERNLSTLLARAVNPDNALTLEGLHGFLFGLAIIPDIIMPSDWLPGVFGEEMMNFKNKAEADKLMGHLFAAYNRINEDNELKFPFDMEKLKKGDVERMQDWSYGLFLAMSLSPETWGMDDEDEEVDDDDLSEEEQEVSAACGVIIGVAMPDEIPELFEPTKNRKSLPKTEKLLVTLYTMLPRAFAIVRDHGIAQRKKMREELASLVPPKPRSLEKIGRNDPCPCGSGKKYKNCCGMN